MADMSNNQDMVLTLFDTDSENESFEDTEDSELEESGYESKHIPINEAIVSAPTSYAEFLELLLPRFHPNLKMTNVSIEDQQSLTKILIGELASQFVIISHQIDDPFLSPPMNKELHRSIFVEVAYILETLFHVYLTKASRLRTDSVLNLTAQLSCLRAELVIVVNKRLNIPLIRRKVLARVQTGSSPHHVSVTTKRDKSFHGLHDDIQKITQMQLKLPVVHLPVTDDDDREKSEERELFLIPYKESTYSAVGSSVSGTSRVQSSHMSSSVVHGSKPPSSHDKVGTTDRAVSYTALTTNSLFHEMGMKEEKGDDLKKCRKKFLELLETPSLDTIQDIHTRMVGRNRDPLQKVTPKLGEYTDEMLRNDVANLAKGEMKVPSSLIKTDTSEELSPLLAAYTSIKEPTKLIESEEPNKPSRPPHPPPLSKESSSWKNDQEESTDQLLLPPGGAIPRYSIDIRSLEGLGESDQHSPCSFLSSERGEEEELEDRLIMSQNLSQLTSINSNVTLSVQEHKEEEEAREEGREEEREEEREEGKDEEVQRSSSPPLVVQDLSNLKSQPDVLSVTLENSTARASDVRVSQRSPLFSLRLQPYPAFYNELTDDLDIVGVEQLDSNLKEGQDIHEIYKELSQTFSKDHLNFEKDPILQTALDKKVKMSSLYASTSLHHRKSRRVINDVLIHAGLPPWKNKTRREWLNMEQSVRSPNTAYQKSWKSQDKDSLSVDDYFKFVANRGSDYLGVVHHMYDSDGSDSEDEQKEEEKKRQQELLRQELLAKEMRRLELLRQKNSYTSGEWNVNSVVMGGLGNDPDEISDQQGASSSIDWSSVQARLSKIWSALEVSHEDQVTMAIKFSNPQFSFYIPKVLSLWEDCCEAIKVRESALSKLESFERHASDPSRHFSKGTSSLTRLREAKQRTSLHKDLDSHDKQVLTLVKSLSKHDCTLTYKGRNYVEKMQMDRVELLYFLHQQRRQTVLKPALQLLNLN